MKKLIFLPILLLILCAIIGHKSVVHLDYIWGNLPREHVECSRCDKTLKFARPTQEREDELYKLNDIRDGDVSGCKPL